MARIRTIKPEFWTDEKVGACSVSARLLLIASLNFADDYGGLERSSKQLKAQVFPYDSIDCEPLILELIRVGLLIEYQVADRKYLHIKGFSKHQRVEKPAKPKIPLYEESANTHLLITEPSPTPLRLLPEELRSLRDQGRDQGREGIKEGKGVGRDQEGMQGEVKGNLEQISVPSEPQARPSGSPTTTPAVGNGNPEARERQEPKPEAIRIAEATKLFQDVPECPIATAMELHGITETQAKRIKNHQLALRDSRQRHHKGKSA